MREQVMDVKQLEAFSEDGFAYDAELNTRKIGICEIKIEE